LVRPYPLHPKVSHHTFVYRHERYEKQLPALHEGRALPAVRLQPLFCLHACNIAHMRAEHLDLTPLPLSHRAPVGCHSYADVVAFTMMSQTIVLPNTIYLVVP
jgi:hypothetical protein